MNPHEFKTSITSLSDQAFDVALYHQSLELRCRTFVDQMKWELPTLGKLETDQYDTLFSHHVVTKHHDKVVGTLRLLPTDHNIYGSTYMILDSHMGKLPGMPCGILETAIQEPDTWEASRLALCATIPPNLRNAVLGNLMKSAISFIQNQGGSSMLGLMNPVFIRIFRRIGMNVSQFGPIKDQKDGPVCVLKYDF